MGCCESQLKKINNDLKNYRTKLAIKLYRYTWDTGVTDCFAKKICKENEVSLTVANKWIELYSCYMNYIGWLFNPLELLPVNVPKPSPDINSYLIVPYEILQV